MEITEASASPATLNAKGGGGMSVGGRSSVRPCRSTSMHQPAPSVDFFSGVLVREREREREKRVQLVSGQYLGEREEESEIASLQATHHSAEPHRR